MQMIGRVALCDQPRDDGIGHIAPTDQSNMRCHPSPLGVRCPNNAVPIRTQVLPAAIACVKSSVIPMDNVSSEA